MADATHFKHPQQNIPIPMVGKPHYISHIVIYHHEATDINT